MTRPSSPTRRTAAGPPARPRPTACPRCRALEDRIAALEAEAAALRAAAAGVDVTAARRDAAAPLVVRPAAPGIQGDAADALRLGRGMGLAAVARRGGTGWTNEPHAYQCLPLVIANQWGWQVLCPTDVRVTWDGTPGLDGPARRGGSPVRAGDQEPVRRGDRHVLAPLAVPHPARLGPLPEGAEQPLEAQLRPARGRHRDLVAQLYLHPELEARRARHGRLRPGREPRPARARPARHVRGRHGARGPDRPARARGGPRAPGVATTAPAAHRPGEVNVHHLYRKAEGVEDHLHKVGVPAIESIVP